MDKTDELLKERGEIHGDHELVYTAVQILWKALDEVFLCSNTKLKPSSKVELKLILMKICRACYNPYHEDNYIDIKGYAELIRSTEVGDGES